MALSVGTLEALLKLRDEMSPALTQATRNVKTFAAEHRQSFEDVAKAAGIAGGAALAIGATLVELGTRGAEVGDIRDQFEALNARVGNTGDTIGGLRAAFAGTVSDFEAMKATNLSLSQGLKITSGNLELTAKAARVLADRTGGDTVQAYEALLRAMATGQTRGLKMIGLHYDEAAALEVYAKAHGRAADNLTEAEQLEAKQAGQLAAMRNELALTGEAGFDFADGVAAVKAELSNLYDTAALVTSGVLVDLATQLGQGGLELGNLSAIAGTALNVIGNGFVNLATIGAGAIRGLVEAITAGGSTISSAAGVIFDVLSGKQGVREGMASIAAIGTSGINAIGAALTKAATPALTFKNYAAGAGGAAKDLGDKSRGLAAAADAAAKAEAKHAKEIRTLDFALLGMDLNLKAASEAMDRFALDALGVLPPLADLTKETDALSAELAAAAPELDVLTPEIQRLARETDAVAAAEGRAKAQAMFFEGVADLAGALGGRLGEVVGQLGNVAEGFLDAWAKGDKMGAVLGAISGIGKILSSSTTPAVQKLGGAMQGAASGAKIGTAILPGYGTAIGAVVGGIIGWIGASKKLKAELKALTNQFVEQQGGLDALKAHAAQAGVSLDAVFKAKDKAALLKAIDDVKGKLDTWDQAHEKLNAAIEKYGISVDQLGPRFAQTKLDEMAAGLLQEWQLLATAGVDVAVLAEKMGPAIDEYVNTAVKAGVDIPQAMKPAIDALYEQGRLLHEDGTAYSEAEYQALSYGKTLSESMAEAVDAIKELVAALTGIPQPNAIHIPVTHDPFPNGDGAPNGPSGGGGANGFANGTPGLGFRDFGRATSATLHGREAVVPENRAAEFAARFGGADVAELRGIRRELRGLPGALGYAVRDSILLAQGTR